MTGEACHCGLGSTTDCATKPWGCAHDQDHAGPCERHPDAPVIGGMCGGCTIYPSDFPKGGVLSGAAGATDDDPGPVRRHE